MSKLATVRELNRSLDLPPQERNCTIFNGGYFDAHTLESIRLPLYNFQHPLSDHPFETIRAMIQDYGILLGRANSPNTTSVGVSGVSSVNDLCVTLAAHEINRSGCWTFVQRTVFLHRPLPLCSVDFVAPSQLHAQDNQRPPSDNFYLRPADLGKPERVLV